MNGTTPDIEKLKEALNSYTDVSGIHLSCLDLEGRPVFHVGERAADCRYCHFLSESSAGPLPCRKTFIYGRLQSLRFGGRYIYFCQSGLLHYTSPIFMNGEPWGSIVSEPVTVVDRNDYFETDILPKYPINRDNLGKLTKLLEDVPYVSPERLHSLSEQLFFNACYLSGDASSRMGKVYESHKLQSVISGYILQVKKSDEISFSYPIEKEEALLDTMARGDKKEARALLNEILGQIFFYSGYKFEVIKYRVIELVALLSRAAVKGGADMGVVLGLNYEYLKEMEKIDSIEDLAYWLSVVMNRFMEYVFRLSDVKHVDVIHKSLDYIKKNYFKKLSLEEAAQFVYLSPSYFSKIFKDETGETFNSYLNKVRIEQSKRLLLQTEVNLADITNMVGYEEQSYFTKVFKKITGVSPGKYRQTRGIISNKQEVR